MLGPDGTQSLTDLLATLVHDIPDLFRNEIRLARAEASDALTQLLASLGRLVAGSAVAVAALGVLLAAIVNWITTLLVSRGVEPALAASIATTAVAVAAGLVAWALFASATRRLRAAKAAMEGSVNVLTTSAASVAEKF